MKIFSREDIGKTSFNYIIANIKDIQVQEPYIYIDAHSYHEFNMDYFIKEAPLNSQAFILKSKNNEETYFLNKDYEFSRMPNGLSQTHVYKVNGSNKTEESIAFPIQKQSNFIPKKKCLFLDRDGVLIEDTGYPHKVDEIKFIDSIIPTLKIAQDKGFELIITTNQSGIAREMFSVDQFKKCMSFIEKYFNGKGIKFKDTYYSPFHLKGSHPEYSIESIMRKPQCGMHLMASEKHLIDLSKSIMVGDRESDRIFHPSLTSIIIKNENYTPLENKIMRLS